MLPQRPVHAVPADTRRKYHDDTEGLGGGGGIPCRSVAPSGLRRRRPPHRLLRQTRCGARDELLLVICGPVTQHRLQLGPAAGRPGPVRPSVATGRCV